MTPTSRRLLSTAAPLLVLATTGAHAQSTSWRMSPVTSYQARVETYAPVWNKEHAVWVSGVPGNLTFEQQYAATLDSVTTSSVEGALMYLQRDCIDVGATPWTSPKSSRCQRKNNVKVITFLEVQIANPNAALAEYQNDRFTYPEFCPFVEMKDGACIYTNDTVSPVVTINHPVECKQYNGIDGQPKLGPCVGAEAFPTDNVAPYFDTVWFSYPNSCVMNRWADGKTPECRTQYPGGLCPFGTVPDGVTCQFSYKILGYINIDDLVGITAMDARGTVNGSALADDDAAAEASLLNGRNVLANPGLDSSSGSKSKGKEEGAEASGNLTGSGSQALSVSLGDDDDEDDGDSTPANTTFGTWKCRRPGACYKSFWEFCEANNTEFHSTDKDRTLGLSAVTSIEFWGYPSDHRVNKNRTAFMIHMYNKQVKERNKVNVEKMTLLPTVADLAEITKKNPPCYQNSLACYNAHYGCQRHSYAQVCSVCREMGVKCVTKKPSYEFPTLTRVPRTVPDSALRSKFVKAPNAKAANGAAGGSSTRPLGLLVAIMVAAAVACDPAGMLET